MGMNNEGTEISPQDRIPKLDITVSRDKMMVVLKIKADFCANLVTPNLINDFLAKQSIVYGIKEKEIEAICESQDFSNGLIVATGTRPVDEQNGSLEYNVKAKNELKPQEKEDGSVDYYNLGLITEVKKDQCLCTIHPPFGGVEGTDVYGNPVRYKNAPIVKFHGGTNTIVSEDGLHLLAAKDGSVTFKHGMIGVDETYTVRGDVDLSTGNIVFSGSVIVKGDVRQGFKIISGGDVNVKGTVEGAYIKAEGDIILSSGMVGMSTGVLEAKGDIKGKYFENCKLISNGDIIAGVFINCNVISQGSITVYDKILGGSCIAGHNIVSKYIGNDNHVSTIVSISSEKYNSMFMLTKDTELEELKNKLQSAQMAYKLFQKKIILLKDKIVADKNVRNLIVSKKDEMEKQINDLKEEIVEAEKPKDDYYNYKIIARSIAFVGVKVKMASFTENLDHDYNNTKFVATMDGIITGPVSPSDI